MPREVDRGVGFACPEPVDPTGPVVGADTKKPRWPGSGTASERVKRVKRMAGRLLIRAGTLLAAPTGFEPVSPP